MLYALILYLVGHALADYPFQGEFLSRGKNPSTAMVGIPWQGAMAAHAGIHAGMVFVATIAILAAMIYVEGGDLQPLLLPAVRAAAAAALFEFASHAMIDYAKCRRWIGFASDQALHVACKVIMAGAATSLVHGPLV